MSWGQIKHAINGRLDMPLNEQLNGIQNATLTVGGTGANNKLEDSLIVDGSGVLYEIGISQGNSLGTVTIIVDDRLIFDGNMPTLNLLQSNRMTGAYTFNLAATSTQPQQPIVFRDRLEVRIRRSGIAETTSPAVAFVRFDANRAANVQQYAMLSTERIIRFTSSATMSFPDNADGDVTVYAIGRGGDSLGGSRSFGSGIWMGQSYMDIFGLSGENGEIAATDIQIPIGTTMNIVINESETAFAMTGEPIVRVLRGANSAAGVSHTTTSPRVPRPQPERFFINNGWAADPARVRMTPPAMSVTVPRVNAQPGAIILHYHVTL